MMEEEPSLSATPSLQTITDFHTNQDSIQMFWRGTESNYLELDGSSVTNINADAAYAAAQFSDFDPFHARQHILFYNLNDSGDGLLVSDESWLFHAPVALAPAIVQLVGIDQPTEFNYSDISGSLMLN